MIIIIVQIRQMRKPITISQRADRKRIVEGKAEQLLQHAAGVVERSDDVSAIRRVSEEVSDCVRVSEI
jgi:hypothetical protein